MPSGNLVAIEYPVIIAGRVDLLMRNMKVNILLMIFFLTILSGSLTGQALTNWNGSPRAFYISNNGEDDNPGTREQPFKTIDKINELGAIRGDTIYFKGGEHFAGTLKLAINGTKFNKALITSYGKGRAIIDGNINEGVILSGSYFSLNNINVTGKGRKNGNIKEGILIIDAHHGDIRQVKADSFQKSGISIYRSSLINLNNIIASNNGFAGISIAESKNCKIKDCKAINNPGDPTNLTNHSGNGIIAGMCDSILIEHCIATNNGWDMPRKGNGPVGIWAYESNHITIQYCISYRNKTSRGASDGGGFDLDGGVKNSIIQNCLSYENEGSGYGLFQYSGASPWANNTVRYCISINDGKSTEGAAGILVWNNSGDSSQLSRGFIYNNLIYNNNVPAIGFLKESLNKSLYFFNNIFIGPEKIITGPGSGERFIGNIWWSFNNDAPEFRGYKGIRSWRAATGQEIYKGEHAGDVINPFLRGPIITHLTAPFKLTSLNGYKLSEKSLIRNKGVDPPIETSSLPKKDFYGNKITRMNFKTPGLYQGYK